MASEKAMYWLAVGVFAIGLTNSYQQGRFVRVHEFADHVALSAERAAQNGLSKIAMAEVMMGRNPVEVSRLQSVLAQLEANEAMRSAQGEELVQAQAQLQDLNVKLQDLKNSAAAWECQRHAKAQAQADQEQMEADEQLAEVQVPEINVQVPEFEVPEVRIPKVHIPEIRVPAIHVNVPRVDVRVPEFSDRRVMVNDTEIDVRGLPGMESLKALQSLRGLAPVEQLRALQAMQSMHTLDCPHRQLHIQVHTQAKPHTTI